MQPLNRVQGYGHVAKRYGLEESIFLEAVMYWYRTNRAENRNYYDGRWWTHNSLAAFEKLFPWWSGISSWYLGRKRAIMSVFQRHPEN